MPQPERFDVLILGSGQGGKSLAWDLARSGRRIAVVERQWVGGSCPAVACMPSKNEVWGARVAHLARHAGHFGTRTGPVATDMALVRARKRKMVEDENAFHIKAYRESGGELIMASGRFVAPKVIEARLNAGGTRLLTGDQIVLNVGTHAAIPSIPGIEAARPMTHIEALELGTLPPHLIVLGGGYTGVELAQAFRRFGSRVTIVEPGPQLMTREDPDIASEMARILRGEDIEILVRGAPVGVAGRSGESVTLTLRTESGEQKVDGSHLLVATGRVPNTSDIGLDTAKIELDARGFIRADEHLKTSAPDVWAMGECAGSPQFTHISVDDYRIVKANLAGGERSTRDRLVPYVVFTDPPLARVGLSEGEAQRGGIAVRRATLPMLNVLRTTSTDETDGFMKVLVAKDDDRILGFAMIGSEAGEVMAVVETAMLAELPYPKLRDAVLTHLTMAEGLGSLLANVPP